MSHPVAVPPVQGPCTLTSYTDYVCSRLRGCGEGWANHFLVQTRKESALIIEFVSESHVAELIQHQKVIDYTATYNG